MKRRTIILIFILLFPLILFSQNIKMVYGLTPNTVTLNSPANNFNWVTSLLVPFNYTPSFASTIQNSSLWTTLTGSWQRTTWNTTDIINGTANIISHRCLIYPSGTPRLTIIWNIQVFNSTHGIFATSNRTLNFYKDYAPTDVENYNNVLNPLDILSDDGNYATIQDLDNSNITVDFGKLFKNITHIYFKCSEYTSNHKIIVWLSKNGLIWDYDYSITAILFTKHTTNPHWELGRIWKRLGAFRYVRLSRAFGEHLIYYIKLRRIATDYSGQFTNGTSFKWASRTHEVNSPNPNVQGSRLWYGDATGSYDKDLTGGAGLSNLLYVTEDFTVNFGRIYNTTRIIIHGYQYGSTQNSTYYVSTNLITWTFIGYKQGIDTSGSFGFNYSGNVKYLRGFLITGGNYIHMDAVLLRGELIFEEKEFSIIDIETKITNMEGCGNWLFIEKTYYFQVFMNKTPYIVTVSWSDSSGNWMNSTYDYANDTYSYIAEDNIAMLRGVSSSSEGTNTTVIFYIMLTKEVRDSYDVGVSVYFYANTTEGQNDTLTLSDYFNIYNVGGSTRMEYSGNAGRKIGEDAFNLYAYNDSAVRVNMTYRHFQHLHLLLHLGVEEPDNDDIASGDNVLDYNPTQYPTNYYGYWDFGVDYCVNDTWVDGWNVIIDVENADVGTHNWVVLRCRWIQKATLIKTDYVSTMWRGRNEDTDNMRVWVDLWINKENASTTCSGRIASYWWGMEDTVSWWKFWYADWQPYTTNCSSESIFVSSLLDKNDNVISMKDITLFRIYHQVGRGTGISDMWYETQEIVESSIETVLQDARIEGVPTPTFQETKVPSMASGGFLSGIFQAIASLGSIIGNAIAYSFVTAGTILTNAIDDTLYFFFGVDNVFMGFVTGASFWLGQVWTMATWMTDALGGFIGFMVNIGSSIANILTGFFWLIANSLTYPVQAISGFITALGDLWNGTGMFEGAVPFRDYWVLFTVGFICFVIIGTANNGWGFLFGIIEKGFMIIRFLGYIVMFGINILRKIIGIIGDLLPF